MRLWIMVVTINEGIEQSVESDIDADFAFCRTRDSHAVGELIWRDN